MVDGGRVGVGIKPKEMALSPPWEHRPDASRLPKQEVRVEGALWRGGQAGGAGQKGLGRRDWAKGVRREDGGARLGREGLEWGLGRQAEVRELGQQGSRGQEGGLRSHEGK